MVHRPQRSERKDPFPQIPFVIEDTDVPGDKFVGWACVFALGVMLVLAVLS